MDAAIAKLRKLSSEWNSCEDSIGAMEATISCDAFVSGLSVMSDGDDVLLFAHKGISIRLDRESALELAARIIELTESA